MASARQALEHGNAAQIKTALGLALPEIDRLRGTLGTMQQKVAAEKLNRIVPDDGGAAMLVPEETREGDIITLPTGRMYKVVGPKEAMLQNDLGPIPLAPRLTR